MSTRDITPPHEDKKGAVRGEKNQLPTHRVSTAAHAEKTNFHRRTEHFNKNKHKDLLLITEPIDEGAKARVSALPFVLIMLLLGFITVFGFIGLNLATQKTKTVDFYVSEAKAASRRLKEGAELFSQKKLNESGERFLQAERSLQAIDRQIWFVPVSKSFSFVDPRLRSVRAAVQASILLAQTGEKSAQLGTEVLPYIQDPQLLHMPITDYMQEKRGAIEDIVAKLAKAKTLINNIDTTVLPADFVEEYSKARTALTTITQTAQNITANFDGIMDFLGAKKPHTTLVVLQNASELRPTGGFIGNIALVQFDKGALTQQQVSDVYAFDHRLTEKIEPPGEIKLINDRWFLRDSNSSINFPTSAQNIARFFEKEGGPHVDTVVTIDQSVVENLLRVTGPLKIQELASELTAENFERVLSFIVEAKIYGREDPKVLLKSLLPALQKATLDSKKALEVYEVLSDAIASKHSMAYSTNENIAALISHLDAEGVAQGPDTGNVSNPTTTIADFFALAHYSIGGNKSDEYMKEKITHNTLFEEDGSLVDEVTITRTNTWNQKSEDNLRAILATFGFKEIPEHVLQILGKSFNIHMLRVYAPRGSVLVESDKEIGVTAHDDAAVGATYFSTRLEVAPGDSNSLTLRYKLPYTVATKSSLLSPTSTLTYSLNVIKQPGQDGVLFEKNIFPVNGMHVQSNAKTSFTVTRDTTLRELLVR